MFEGAEHSVNNLSVWGLGFKGAEHLGLGV